ncbi:lysylphosphatidylglycerol synthase transmembrane domain-containing protein [Dethiosulfovibrio peptidovorans]|uniref:lysylphosphatidylglycerol synthase transmembrane domain-containing protein n=1 Tax=Dethiosulfovibrio peptidovorans TaxID=47055 RepID=UPI00019E6598|nr:flippase-like domain-containing protein [Dethiosulfovibrio peptidovorans]
MSEVSLRKGLAIFLLLSFGVSSVVLAFSVDGSTWSTLLTARKGPMALAFLLVLGAWLCDAIRFCSLARAMDRKISIPNGIILTWLHYFGCAVTPMQVGGGPFQVYVLYRSGVPIGKGVAITLVRTLLTTFILSVAAPLSFLLNPRFMNESPFLVGIFYYVLLISILAWGAFGISVVRPDLVKKAGSVLVLWLNRFNVIGKYKILCTIRRINLEIDGYSANLRYLFSRGIGCFTLAFVMSLLHLVFLFSVLPCLIWSIGLEVNYVESFLAQAIFLFVLYFVPTPGASGVAEGGGAAIFGLLVPWSMAGVTAIAWRFFTEYLAIIMGAIVAVRFIGWGTAEMIIKNRRRECDDLELAKSGRES